MRERGKRYLACLLTLAMCLGLLPTVVLAAEGETYTLVTDVADLAAGDQIIIAALGSDKAMAAYVSGNNCKTVDIVKSEDTIVAPAGTQFITLASGSEAGSFAFQVDDTPKYLYAAGSASSGNNLKTTATLDAKSSWSISIDGGTGSATIQAKVDTSQVKSTIMRYNSSSTLFSCYASGQADIGIYKLASTTTNKSAKPTASETSGGVYLKGVDTVPSITLTAGTGASIYYTTDGTVPTASSTLYSTPIELADGVNTIKAIAVETDKDPSSTATFTYTVLDKSSVAQALAASEKTLCAVEGVVTLISSGTVYIEDATGAIALRPTSTSGLTVGDTVVAVGSRTDFNGLPQLGSAECTKGAGGTLPLTETTIENINTDATLLCKRVKLTGLTLGTKAGDNIPLTDASGNTINIYAKYGPTLGADAVPGATVTVTAVVSTYNTTRQLLVGAAGDVVVTAAPSKVQTPTASPASGNIAPGGIITFACATADAVISYSTDNGTNWTEGSSYTVPDNAEVDSTVTLKVKATHATLPESEEATFTYTVKDSPVGKYAKVSTTLAQGDQFVILYKKDSMAMTQTASGKKLKGVEAEVRGDYLQIAQDMSILTAAKDADGHYTFTNGDGKYLTSGETGSSLSFADVPSDYSLWDIKTVTDGVHIVSVNAAYNSKKQAVEYYSGFTTFSEANTDAFLMGIYVITDEPPVFPAETPIFAPTSSVTDSQTLSVTITCATTDAKIYYTTDGTEPTTASSLYSGAFSVDLSGGAVTVKAVAVKDGMQNSPIASKKYMYVASDADFIPVLSVDDIKTGGYFVVIPQSFSTKALSTSFAFKPTAVDVTLADGSYAPTLKFAAMGDGVSIQYEATQKYIGYSGSGTDFAESASAFKFTLTANPDGTFRIVPNNASNRAISYRGSGETGVFAPYTTGNDGKTDDYGTYECDMLLYKSKNGYLYNPQAVFGVVNDAVPGQDYVITYSFTETDVVSNVAAQYSLNNTDWTPATLDAAAQTITVPGSVIPQGSGKLYLKLTATDTRGSTVKSLEKTVEVAVKDEPVIAAVSPLNGAETGEGNRKPNIQVTVLNGGTFTAKVTVKPKTGTTITDAEMTVAGDTASYTPAADLAEGWCEVSVTVTRDDGKSVSKSWAFTVGVAKYQNYFGQLHSHTAEYSDGAGTLDEALSYIKNTAYRNNVQFVSFTDHSNYFDGTTGPKNADGTDGTAAPEGALYDTSLLTPAQLQNWQTYKKKAADFNAENAGSMVALAGFEMTWSGGPGHINTFNTPGIVSRNNKTLNNKTNDAGMKAYYSLLSNDKGADSISQFNHPGTTFGTFSEFAHYDPVIDSRITLVEVGNGEGAIGSGGYFPSYSEYIKALDKGWHLAPTNNQDNHKGHWGDSNDARTVIYASDLSEQNVYQAMREMRLYATEDKNLEITYTVNDELLGSILDTVPAQARFQASVSDPDGEKISTVEIVSNGGAVIHKVDVNAAAYELDYTLDAPKAGYYFLRVTQADKDIAVTAPVWLGKAKNVGMSELSTDTFMVVSGEAVTLTNQFFNNESTAAVVKSLTYAIKDGATLSSSTPNQTIAAMGTWDNSFTHTFAAAGEQTVELTAVVEVGGESKTLKSSIQLDVKDPDALLYIGIDGSHHNEYVSGNYKDSMGNFGTLAADYDVRVNVLNTSAELMAALQNPKYKMMIFTTPTRRLALTDTWTAYDVYTDAELAAVTAFAQGGGTVVVTGWGDYYESYNYCPKDADMQMSAQQNKLLAAIGSTLRVADDEAKDTVNKPGNNASRLYLTDYNGMKSPLLAGVDPSQVWSQYGGSTIYAVDAQGECVDTLPDTVIPIVSGYGKFESDGSGIDLDKIDSHDDDSDGYMNGVADKTVKPPKYPSDKGLTCLLTASETVTHANGKQSLVMVSGGAFMSNFEIKFDADNVTQLGYSNPVVLGNLVESLNPPVVTDIATVQAQGQEGDEFTVVGYVTANTSGFDKDTAFFDCTYVQDDTAGINIFPVSDSYQVGQKIRVTGSITSYQGEKELTVKSIKMLDRTPVELTPIKVTTEQAASGDYLGSLIQVQGTVTSIELANGAIQTIRLKDSSGVEARLFIDGYITASKDAELQSRVAVGKEIVAIGLASYDNTFNADGSESNRIRIRDRADITATGSVSYPAGDNVPTTGGAGAIRLSDVKEKENQVEVTIRNAAKATISKATQEKLTALNEKKPVVLTGDGLNVIIPKGTLTKKSDVTKLLAKPKTGGNAVQVTLKDGSKEIVPFALVSDKAVAYVAKQEGSYEVVDNAKTFTDVPVDYWGASAVDFVSTNELFRGVGENVFGPDTTMTRAMLVTVLARLDGQKELGAEASVFADVESGSWYTDAVAWAAQAKIVEGDGVNFAPEAAITREQLCVILVRYLDYAGFTMEQTNTSPEFTDTDTVSGWAKESVDAAIRAGLISGKPGGRIDPQGQASRAEIATIIQRMIKSIFE